MVTTSSMLPPGLMRTGRRGPILLEARARRCYPPAVRARRWLVGILLAATPGRAAELPLFDTHIHYSMPDWSVYTPEAALGILGGAGVRRALVSSTPDDGTVRLYEKDPGRVVPELRPYRTRADMATWSRDPAVLAYVEER